MLRVRVSVLGFGFTRLVLVDSASQEVVTTFGLRGPRTLKPRLCGSYIIWVSVSYS